MTVQERQEELLALAAHAQLAIKLQGASSDEEREALMRRWGFGAYMDWKWVTVELDAEMVDDETGRQGVWCAKIAASGEEPVNTPGRRKRRRR